MKPVRAGLATRSIRASRPLAFSSIWRHCSAVRWSFQSNAGRNGLGPLPRKTLPCIWPERPMPPMSAGRSLAFFSTALVAFPAAAHQSSGFCSDQPGLGEEIGCSAIAVAITVPSSSQMSVLVPLVPMSIPSRCGMGWVSESGHSGQGAGRRKGWVPLDSRRNFRVHRRDAEGAEKRKERIDPQIAQTLADFKCI